MKLISQQATSKLVFPLLVVFFIFFHTHGETFSGLKNGDLVFVVEGDSKFSKAISDATAAADSLKFVHVGILETD